MSLWRATSELKRLKCSCFHQLLLRLSQNKRWKYCGILKSLWILSLNLSDQVQRMFKFHSVMMMSSFRKWWDVGISWSDPGCKHGRPAVCRCSSSTLWTGRTCCSQERWSGAPWWRRTHRASWRWSDPPTTTRGCEAKKPTSSPSLLFLSHVSLLLCHHVTSPAPHHVRFWIEVCCCSFFSALVFQSTSSSSSSSSSSCIKCFSAEMCQEVQY